MIVPTVERTSKRYNTCEGVSFDACKGAYELFPEEDTRTVNATFGHHRGKTQHLPLLCCLRSRLCFRRNST